MITFYHTYGGYKDDVGTIGRWSFSADISCLYAFYYRLKRLLLDSDVFVEFDGVVVLQYYDNDDNAVEQHYVDIADYLDDLYKLILAYRESIKEDSDNEI